MYLLLQGPSYRVLSAAGKKFDSQSSSAFSPFLLARLPGLARLAS